MFQPGDLVQRKTGGPLMTVVESAGDFGFVCQWFDGFDPKSAIIPEASLLKTYAPPKTSWRTRPRRSDSSRSSTKKRPA